MGEVLLPEESLDKILKIIKDLQLKTNLVMWSSKKLTDDKFFIQKKYGKHIDSELDEKMKEGIEVLPPSSVFLMSPHIATSRLTAEIGKRLLTSAVIFIPNKRIKDAIRYALILIPEFGRLSNNNTKIIFKKKPRIDNIREKTINSWLNK